MFKPFAALSVAAIAFAALPAAASAADLDQIMLAPELPLTRPVEVGSGWYLRGDIGYAIETSGDAADYRLYDPLTEQLLADDWAGQIGDAWLAPDGSAFVSAGRVYRFDSGPLAATPAVEDGNGLGGGWLGGGTYLP